jgi:hypothetical protein
MALTSYTFAQLLNFSRASTKMLFNSAGVLTQVASGAPGFPYDPIALTPRGLSLEEADTNLLFPSADASTVMATHSNITFPGVTATAPDGTATLEKIVGTSSGTVLSHYLATNPAVTANLQQQVTFECWLKAAEYSQGKVTILDDQTTGNTISVVFNLTAATVATSATGTGVASGATLTPYANGVFKLTLTGQPTTNTSQTTALIDVYIYNAAGSSTYAGDGTSGLFIGGIGFKLSGIPSSYIPTTSAAATRAADACSLISLSPWFNPAAGTIFVQARVPNLAPAGKDQVLVRFDDGTTANAIEINNPAGTGNIQVIVTTAGAVVFQQVGGTFTAGSVVEAAVSYASNAFAFSVNGNAALVGTTGAVPSGISRCILGARDLAGTAALNGEMQDLNYYPVAVAASNLPALT